MTTQKVHKFRGAKLLLVASLSVLALSGCKHMESGTRVAGWSFIDPAQRHPILVSQEPTTLDIQVPVGAYGLSPRQRSRLIQYYGHFRETDDGTSRMVISAPSGAPNEVAAIRMVEDIRKLLADQGVKDSDIIVEAYHEESEPQPPIHLSYLRHIAHAPDCSNWPTNLAHEPANIPYPDFGCATQRAFAVQVANPSDLLGPRTMTPRSSERRDAIWKKYAKGEATSSKKSEDEKVSSRGKK